MHKHVLKTHFYNSSGSSFNYTGVGGYRSTSLDNLLENSFQPGLAFRLKDVTVPTVCRGSVVDSGWMARDLPRNHIHRGFVDRIKAELRPDGADAVKSSQGTGAYKITKSGPDLVICFSTSRDEFDGGRCFQFEHKDGLVFEKYFEWDHMIDRLL